LPTRPGVEVSWCRTISTGSRDAAVEGAPAAAPGKRRMVAAAGLFDGNGIDFLFAGYQARSIPKSSLISCEFTGTGRIACYFAR
jgi:hypothetical protein